MRDGCCSLENEDFVLQQLYDLATQRLATYSTTLEEDLELLKDMDAFPFGSKKRNVRNILKDEKQLLHYLIEFTYVMSEWLDLTLEELDEAMTTRYSQHPDLRETEELVYAQQVIQCLVEKYETGSGRLYCAS